MPRKIIVATVAVMIVAVIGISTTTISAQTHDIPTLLDRIQELEKRVADQHIIAMEQARIILSLIDQIPKQYADYSLQEFPDTGGYDPRWLADNRDMILQTCTDAQSDGFNDLNFCQYVS